MIANQTTLPLAPVPGPAGSSVLPRLENGDHLTRAEFLRRYDAMPDAKKAELIEGIVYMGSPVSLEGHGSPHADLITWLGNFRAATIGVAVADNTTTLLDLDNTPQPDGALLIKPEYGGRTKRESDYISGGPELVVEVSGSSASIDLNSKFRIYRRNGVEEYIVWRVYDRQIDWYRLKAGAYEPLAVGSDGILRSETFPGLWLDPAALLAGDLARVLRVLQQGTDSAEHAQFVRTLADRGETHAR